VRQASMTSVYGRPRGPIHSRRSITNASMGLDMNVSEGSAMRHYAHYEKGATMSDHEKPNETKLAGPPRLTLAELQARTSGSA